VEIETKLQRVRSFIVYRTGEVRFQGPALAHGSSLIIDLLPDSILTPEASRRNVIVRRPDGTEYTYDLLIFQLAGVRTPSSALQGGDIIHVPRATTKIGVWGGASRPREFELGPDDRLSTLLILGGGLLPSAFVDSALFVRGMKAAAKESIWVSIADIDSGTYDPLLLDGDNLFVMYDPDHRDLSQVTVVGQVGKAGEVPIELGRTRFTDVITAVGGFRPNADTTAIRLIRARPDDVGSNVEFNRLSRLPREQMTNSEYETFRTQLAALSPDFRIEWDRVRKGDPLLDPILMDGDVIRVDRRTNTVRVDGQVRRPGVFEFEPGKDARYYIDLAGGFADRGSRTKVRVTRAVNGQSVREKDAEQIAPGDFVWVPERPDRVAWDYIREIVFVAAQAAIIVTAIIAVQQ
jgi:protein involved in polysaccharide export with SLBB domain